jgi:hypothetical protein
LAKLMQKTISVAKMQHNKFFILKKRIFK